MIAYATNGYTVDRHTFDCTHKAEESFFIPNEKLAYLKILLKERKKLEDFEDYHFANLMDVGSLFPYQDVCKFYEESRAIPGTVDVAIDFKMLEKLYKSMKIAKDSRIRLRITTQNGPIIVLNADGNEAILMPCKV